jgi:hypothetical protein
MNLQKKHLGAILFPLLEDFKVDLRIALPVGPAPRRLDLDVVDIDLLRKEVKLVIFFFLKYLSFQDIYCMVLYYTILYGTYLRYRYSILAIPALDPVSTIKKVERGER